MARWIYEKEILKILEGKNFDTEKEMEEYVTSQLPSLIRVKKEQIDEQSITTSFDKKISNCADIVIRSNDPEIRKALLVIELKLTKSIDKFKDGDYIEAIKQLHKYCQDVKAPYGILLTDKICFIYRYNYLKNDQEFEKVITHRIPNLKIMEDRTTREAFFDFLIRRGALKYLYLFLGLAFVAGILILEILKFTVRVLLGV